MSRMAQIFYCLFTFLFLLGATFSVADDAGKIVTSDPKEVQRERCNLKPEGGPCKALFERYYFDPVSKKCRPFFYGGCDGVVPFETLEACKSQCE